MFDLPNLLKKTYNCSKYVRYQQSFLDRWNTSMSHVSGSTTYLSIWPQPGLIEGLVGLLVLHTGCELTTVVPRYN